MKRLLCSRDDRRGFVLPVVLIVITFVSVSLAAAYALSSAERRVLDNTGATLEAATMAQTGLEGFVANRKSLGFTSVPPAPYESTRVALRNGFADVVLQQIQGKGLGNNVNNVYVIRSRGVLADRGYATAPLAERVVAQVAVWQSGLKVRAGWTSLTGLRKNGAAGNISGIDRCGADSTVAGVAVPHPPGMTGSRNPSGLPPIEDLGTVSQAIDSIDIDWAGIVDGSQLEPDVEIPGQPWPSFWDSDYWPVIVVRGDWSLTPPMSGRGLLIVTGNLTISGSASWDGILLVGQKLTSNGNNHVNGATYSGLDVLLGGNPDSAAAAIGEASVGNGNKTYQYDSCNVGKALNPVGELIPIQNAWMDNWSTY